MTSKRAVSPAACLAVFVLLTTSALSMAQNVPTDQKPAELWDNLIHYIKVAHPVLARSHAKSIVESSTEPRVIYRLSAEVENLDEVLKQGERLPEMKEFIAKIRKIINEGLRVEASDASEITKSIGMLGGTLSQYQEGVRRLKLSGEYCLPQLLYGLVDSNSKPLIRERIVTVLPQLGQVAVRGLAAALQSDNPKIQEAVAAALGRIGYPHAAPRLQELAQRDGVLSRVATAAKAAVITCAGREAVGKSVSQLSFELAEKYYYGAESLRPSTRHDTANVWYWKKSLGLTFTPVVRPIFLDVYAMRMAKMALKHDQKSAEAVSLWLAAGLRKESHLPDGATDPTHAEGTPGAKYYALAAGPRFLLAVLDRGLRDKDSVVSLGAISALAETSTADSLVMAQPLVKALTFSDRRVRFLAAVSLGGALPREKYDGSAMVMTVLKQTLRQRGKTTVLVIVAGERGNAITGALREADYEVVSGGKAAKAMTDGRSGSGIDVVVLAGDPAPIPVIRMLRKDPGYSGAPIVVVSQNADLTTVAVRDKRIVTIEFDTEAEDIPASVDKALSLAVGQPLDDADADQWVIRAASTIRLLGQTGNDVYQIKRAMAVLVKLTKSGKDPQRVAACGALAVMDSPEAQNAIAQLACSAEAEEGVRVKAFGALSESLRRFVNQLGKNETQAVLDTVSGSESMSVREAAAQALGAMGLKSEKAKSLILK